jgi:hypothetical protein
MDMCKTWTTLTYHIIYHFERTVGVMLTRSMWMVFLAGSWVGLCVHVLWKPEYEWKIHWGSFMLGKNLALRKSNDRSCTDSLLTAKMLLKIYVSIFCHWTDPFCASKTKVSEPLEILLMIFWYLRLFWSSSYCLFITCTWWVVLFPENEMCYLHITGKFAGTSKLTIHGCLKTRKKTILTWHT